MSKPKFTTKALEKKIDSYFKYCYETEEPPTITGLCFKIGFVSRSQMKSYENNPIYRDIVQKARLRVEYSYELDLRSKFYAGSIFALKNMGWADIYEESETIKPYTPENLETLINENKELLKQLSPLPDNSRDEVEKN